MDVKDCKIPLDGYVTKFRPGIVQIRGGNLYHDGFGMYCQVNKTPDGKLASCGTWCKKLKITDSKTAILNCCSLKFKIDEITNETIR
jgi:hypothetical protein